MSQLPSIVTTTAKKMAIHYEAMEDLTMMEGAKAGESRRAYDFIRNDLPVMLTIADGKDPSEINLNSRQKALLQLTPADAAKKIEEDASSARRILGWTAPFATGANKDFVLGRDNFTGSLISNFKSHLETQKEPEFTGKGYSNSKEHPLSPVDYDRVLKNEAIGASWPRVGDDVIQVDNSKPHDPTRNPYDAETKKVEEVVFRQDPETVAGRSPYYYTEYRLEGDKDFIKKSDMLDPRGVAQTYGVVAERAGKLYFVEVEGVSGPHEPENMVAREIIGASKEYAGWINSQIKTSGNELAVENPSPDIKWALSIEEKEPIAGEMRHYNVDGPADMAGPIVIDGSSWQSGVGEDEKKWAIAAIERHLEKYEYPSRTIDEVVTKQRGNREVLVNGPQSEMIRYGAMQQNMAR